MWLLIQLHIGKQTYMTPALDNFKSHMAFETHLVCWIYYISRWQILN